MVSTGERTPQRFRDACFVRMYLRTVCARRRKKKEAGCAIIHNGIPLIQFFFCCLQFVFCLGTFVKFIYLFYFSSQFLTYVYLNSLDSFASFYFKWSICRTNSLSVFRMKPKKKEEDKKRKKIKTVYYKNYFLVHSSPHSFIFFFLFKYKMINTNLMHFHSLILEKTTHKIYKQ